MVQKLPFLNSEWFYPVLMATFIIWLVFIWKERQRYPTAKFYINSLVALVSITALALLYLKPLKYSSPKPFEAAIITDNHELGSVDSLKSTYETLRTYEYRPGQRLFSEKEVPKTIHVIGNGIEDYDLWQLDSIKTNYVGGKDLKGIIALNYARKYSVGDQIRILGSYRNPKNQTKLVLQNPGGNAVDSIILDNKDLAEFELKTDLKASGKFVYSITEKDSIDNIVKSDPIPIVVDEAENLRILIVNDFPSFETKYLKNFLASQDHEVIVRSQLTKDKFKHEYFNTNSRPRVSLSKTYLKNYDLLIIDAASFYKLSRRYQNNIRSSVEEDGLGVFIQPNEAFLASNDPNVPFRFTRTDKKSSTINEWAKTEITTYPYSFRGATLQTAIHSNKSRTLSAYRQLGFGKISTSVLMNTYELQLKGNSRIYKEIWSNILESISKKNITRVLWKPSKILAFEHEPFDFSISTSIELPTVLTSYQVEIPLIQHPEIPTYWSGTVYPRTTGWNALYIQQDSTQVLHFYVMNSAKWTSLKAQQTINMNKREFSTERPLKKASIKQAEVIDLYWLFVVFLLSIGYLWLEPKL